MRENLQIIAIATSAGVNGGEAASHLTDLVEELEPREEWDISDPSTPPPPEMDAEQRQLAVMGFVRAGAGAVGGIGFERVKVSGES